ncbi:tetratricopeptide repeat protein [Collimonas pratensis]|uniref:TPR repeat family protein n=1 Tax=Collimonas pratensis TaxID=279113 RepID=A0ABM5Z924_9BURK|nr:tetratricopeptide repeat protein [Collimonas pratensis]AMP15312.1 TPR repeat family protein [Collimonas pratensis]
MKILTKSLLLLLLGLDANLSACAEDGNWGNLNNQAVALSQQGQYPAAIAAEKSALQLIQGSAAALPLDVAGIMSNLAWLYSAQKQYALAEPFLKRVLTIKERILGQDHQDVASTLSQLALVYRQSGREENAEYVEKRAAAILRLKPH